MSYDLRYRDQFYQRYFSLLFGDLSCKDAYYKTEDEYMKQNRTEKPQFPSHEAFKVAYGYHMAKKKNKIK